MVISLWQQIIAAGLPEPEVEVKFHPTRRWRFDLAWPEYKLAAEQEGGVWVGGRHTRGRGYENDCRKYSEAAILGWAVLRFTTDMIASGEAIEMVQRAIEAKRNIP